MGLGTSTGSVGGGGIILHFSLAYISEAPGHSLTFHSVLRSNHDMKKLIYDWLMNLFC